MKQEAMKSGMGDHNAGVEQLAARQPHKLKVAGSSPASDIFSCILGFLLFASSCFGVEIRKAEPVITREDLRLTVEHIRELSRAQTKELAEALNKIAFLEAAKAEADESRKKVDAEIQEIILARIAAIHEADAAKAHDRKTQERYHKLKLICAAIAAIGGAVLGMNVASLVPGLWKLVVPMVMSGAAFAMVWSAF